MCAVITWMTRPSYGKTASDLDTARLSEQMSRGAMIFDKLTGIAVPEIADNHPVLDMWRGYEFALAIYAMMLNLEFVFARGYADQACSRVLLKSIKEIQREEPDFSYVGPPWVRDTAVIKSHRSNLIRLLPNDYNEQWKVAPKNWPYIWPRIDDTPKGYGLWISRADKRLLHERKLTMPDDDTMARIANWP
jgi:hypothetical protein